MSRPKRTICKECKKEFAHLSSKGLCINCASSRCFGNIRSLKEKIGEPYEKWKRNLLKALVKQGQ